MANEPATRPAAGTAQEVFWTGPQGAIVGLSTDAKPTARADGTALPAGVRFRERDTGLEFEFTGSAWAPVTPATAAASAAASAAKLTDLAPYIGRLVLVEGAALVELRAIRELLALLAGQPPVFPPLPVLDPLT